MVVLYVLDVPEFLPIVETARQLPDCRLARRDCTRASAKGAR
jgi:hypothetical protein